MRPNYEEVLETLELLEKLSEFRPFVIGTPPLGLDVPMSDIDIACFAMDLDYFAEYARSDFGDQDQFSCSHATIHAQPTVLANFRFQGWMIELFCQRRPAEQQWGFRHFTVERRLLEIEPRLRQVIKRLKEDGVKTEPAFAQALGLAGNPYEEILELEAKSDRELAELAAKSIVE